MNKTTEALNQARIEKLEATAKLAEEALVYHTQQTRPIQKTDDALAAIRAARAQEFTAEQQNRFATAFDEAFAKAGLPQKQADQEPVAKLTSFHGGKITFLNENQEYLRQGTLFYAAPVHTKDLTDDEINEVLWRGGPFETVLDATRAVIAADRELNR